MRFTVFLLTYFLVGVSCCSAQTDKGSASRSYAGELADKDGRIRVQISPKNEVVLSSELSARIAQLPLREGDSFRKGVTLIGFDCSPFQAQLKKAQALQEAAAQTLSVNQKLMDLNAIGALEYQQSQAKVKEFSAEVDYMKFTTSRCSISAPFAGRISKRLVAAHQYVTPGTPLVSILDTTQLEVQMIVPSRWLSWIKQGQEFSISMDEMSGTVTARVQRVGARIDPISQSIQIVGVVGESVPGLLSGMSGWATFPNSKRRDQ